MVSPRDWASPPTFTPFPYRLKTVATEVEQFTGHQKLGIMFQSDPCVRPLETTTQCLTGVGATKTPLSGANWRGANPFVVYTWLDCDLVGVGEEELRSRTLLAHQNNVQWQVENIFWTGGLYNTYPHLAYSGADVVETSGGSDVLLQTAATPVVTGAYDIVEGLGLLEYYMGNCYGGRPVIHMAQMGLTHLAANHLLIEKNGKLYTPGGSLVVGAPGYGRTGPNGIAPSGGGFWMYGTGAIKWWQSGVQLMARDTKEMLLRTNNDTVLIAEQWFAIGWDCCHYAVQISAGGVITGTPISAT